MVVVMLVVAMLVVVVVVLLLLLRLLLVQLQLQLFRLQQKECLCCSEFCYPRLLGGLDRAGGSALTNKDKEGMFDEEIFP